MLSNALSENQTIQSLFRKAAAILAAVVFAAGLTSAAEPVQVVPGNVSNPGQPQLAVAESGTAYIAFGAGDAVYCSRSTDGGADFDSPIKLGTVPKLALGMRRGPRNAATSVAIVVTAVSHDEGSVLAWHSRDEGQTWSGPTPINDNSPGTANEGLHAMAAAHDGTLYTVWLDHCLNDENQIFGSASSDGGRTWRENRLIYRSPRGSVCPCCHPAVTVDGDGTVYVMWRNSLDGFRDLYTATSRDRGKTFSSAAKLGSGSWKLDNCPMGGGYIAATKPGQVTTVWRRQHEIFRTDSGRGPEQLLGRGEQPWVAGTPEGPWIVWLSQRGGDLWLAAPSLRLGSTLKDDGCCGFMVWAPRHDRLDLHIVAPEERRVKMEQLHRGYFALEITGLDVGTRYFYNVCGADRPDPASRFQPDGVHGASATARSGYEWTDGGWSGLPLSEYIIYELHVGTFSREGTFQGAIGHLDDLVDLGVTAIEIMPVAQFPGSRNWGYDGVLPFAVQNSYGGPDGLKMLVDACHERGLAVVLDVVYNHLGPEGNYLEEFGYYFTERYHTPWGRALNFDGEFSDEVRRFFIENALYWIRDFHVDALRLDAVHSIFDTSAYPFLEELQDSVTRVAGEFGRQVFTIAESDLNDPRLIRAKEQGGMALDAQWSDDFHHSVHVLLTGEKTGYYADYGGCDDLARTFRDGFAVAGRYSDFRKRRHGRSARDLPPAKFVFCVQNHDQVGNRLFGDRLSCSLNLEQQKLAAGVLLLSPSIPLLFMGQEYGETAPFQYFVSHADPELIESVRRGRLAEFAAFGSRNEGPDPQAEETFNRCKLDHNLRHVGHHGVLWELHKQLLRIRKSRPALAPLSRMGMSVAESVSEQLMTVTTLHVNDALLAVPERSAGNELRSSTGRL